MRSKTTVSDLYQRSIEIILENQHPSGAYVACPNFPTYRFAWFRDASFVAYAMDRAGQHQSAARFHAWAARAVLARRAVIQRGLKKAARGKVLADGDILHTRLTLEGQDVTQEKWGNFQLDGFGTWLWALGQHQQLCQEPLPGEWLAAAGLVAGYLAALWSRPCYDCWEEHPDRVHPHTLAAIYGGLKVYAGWAEQGLAAGPEPILQALAEIKTTILEHYVYEGHFVKFSGQPAVDASLLGLAVPYGVVAPDDPLMTATVAEIERTLLNGGLRRYPTDTYYGGGEWILLTAWLGWYAREAGGGALRRSGVEQILAWIEAHAGPDGSLPEQVPEHLNDPAHYQPWLAKWGPIATPLLWSHAKYMILKK
jgi:GH15 family glucan-1,4-alpha-glucosidase